jgi:hypothetical protein
MIKELTEFFIIMMLIASFSELIGPPLANAGFRGQRRKLILKAENKSEWF